MAAWLSSSVNIRLRTPLAISRGHSSLVQLLSCVREAGEGGERRGKEGRNKRGERGESNKMGEEGNKQGKSTFSRVREVSGLHGGLVSRGCMGVNYIHL